MRLRLFSRDQRGAAAVEFALLLPLMVMLYMGVAELTMAMVAERRAAHAASVMGDLVAQEAQISGAEIDDIFNVSTRIMNPFPSAPLKMRISSIAADASTGAVSVVWFRDKGLGKMTAPPGGMPANLLSKGDSVIAAEVQYDYTSPLGVVLPGAMHYSETFYLRPRKGDQVLWTGPTS